MVKDDTSAELLAVAERLGSAEQDEGTREDDLRLLRDAHWPIEDEVWRRSEVTELLIGWLGHRDVSVRRGAAVALGHVAPGVLLEAIAVLPAANAADFTEGMGEAVWALGEYYFGDESRPGYLDLLADDEKKRRGEYEKLRNLTAPVIAALRGRGCAASLAALVAKLEPPQGG